MTINAIAEKVGCSRTTIACRLKQCGVQLRSRSVSQKLRRYDDKANDPQLKEKIIDCYCNKHKTLIECGAEVGISHGTVATLLEKWGIPRRAKSWDKKKIDKLPADEIIHAYTVLGDSLQIIALRYNVSQMTIRNLLEQHGIKRRSISEARTLAWQRVKEKSKSENTNSGILVPDGSLKEQVRYLRKEHDLYAQDIASILNVHQSAVYEIIMDVQS